MNRITEFEIAGKKYPLNFSVKAAEMIGERYGDISEIGKAFDGDNASKMLSEFVWLLSVLIDQGCAYKRIVSGDDIAAPSLDDLKVIIGMQDFIARKSELMNAIVSGMKPTVEVEPDAKNADTTQDK